MPDALSIASAHGGAFVERIDDAIRECLENIVDPNTEPTAHRSVTVKITLKPDEERELVDLTCQAQAKLVGAKALTTKVVVGEYDGTVEAAEYRSPQEDLVEAIAKKRADQEAETANVKRIGGGGS
jgi:hypothetical protein